MDFEQRSNLLLNGLSEIITPNTVFICIGARKQTSIIDSIGPRIGDKLIKANIPNVYGTNEDPYNGLTFQKMNKIIKEKTDSRTTIIAIDLCSTCNKNKLGKIELTVGSITPGAGVGKSIPAIGHYSIRAYAITKKEINLIHNNVLQNHSLFKEKLNLVYEMVNLISMAIIKAYQNSLEISYLVDDTNKKIINYLI